MNIADLKAKQGKVNVEGEITEISPAREFQRFGKSGKVANAVLKDDSGEITLTLWNEDVDKYNVGDKVKVVNGFVSEWQGALQLSGGRYGSVEPAGESSGSSEDSEEASEPVQDDDADDEE